MRTLKSMTEQIGVSGYEDTVRDYIKRSLGKNVLDCVKVDNIGNLIIHKDSEIQTPSIMIIAHMDEVGFQVINVNEDGSASVKTLGNLKTWNTINQRVSTEDGMKKGVVYCADPEGIKAHDYGKIVIIPTAGKFETGDVFGFDTDLIESDKEYIGKALDNRVSCFILSEIIEMSIPCSNPVDFVFSVQEEIGMRGARVAVSELAPDIVIDLDVSPVGENNSLKMGNGIGIKLSDSVGVSSRNLVNQVEKIAVDANIKYQREVSDCGTSELIITNEKDAGAERIGISIPCLNMHSSLTRVNKEDLEMGLRLVKEILKSGLALDNQ